MLPALMALLPAMRACVSVGPPLLASVVFSTVPTATPTRLPFTPFVNPPAVVVSPIRLLFAVSMVLDTSEPHQVYVEDCEVCCKPIEVDYAIEDEAIAAFEARTL